MIEFEFVDADVLWILTPVLDLIYIWNYREEEPFVSACFAVMTNSFIRREGSGIKFNNFKI